MKNIDITYNYLCKLWEENLNLKEREAIVLVKRLINENKEVQE